MEGKGWPAGGGRWGGNIAVEWNAGMGADIFQLLSSPQLKPTTRSKIC